MQRTAPKMRRRLTVRASTSAPPSLPRHVRPMLATAGTLPEDPAAWNFEFKWDGVRALGFIEHNTLRLESRNLLDITSKYPELQPLATAVGRRAILDGEIVALDEFDRPSFARLQRRMHVTSAIAVARLAIEIPVWYILFDVLSADGVSLIDLPYSVRRVMLEELTVAGPRWQVTAAHVGEGKAMLDAARVNRLEGIMAKRSDSLYTPGHRSPLWRKIKIIQRQEFVIGGWTPQAGAPDRIGALLLGYYDCHGALRYAGGVGTGLADADHHRLVTLLTRQSLDTSLFAEPLPRTGVHFVKPVLVAEIDFRRWPDDGLLQHAAFKGLRTDKDAREVVKESHF